MEFFTQDEVIAALDEYVKPKAVATYRWSEADFGELVVTWEGDGIHAEIVVKHDMLAHILGGGALGEILFVKNGLLAFSSSCEYQRFVNGFGRDCKLCERGGETS